MTTETTDTRTAMPETQLLTVPGGRPDLDSLARRFASIALGRGEAVRVRVQPDLFVPGDGRKYTGWTGVHWKGEIKSFEELVEFRRDLHQFLTEWFAKRGTVDAAAEETE